MNTSLRPDSITSQQPKKQGTHVTTNLFRLSNTTVDIESQLKGLGQRLNKLPVAAPMPDLSNSASSANRDTMYPEGLETRTRRACNVLSAVKIDRFEYPLLDHQKYSIYNESQRGGFHTRNNEKDDYKSKCNI